MTLTQYLFKKLSANHIRMLINCWAPLWGTGITVTEISPDYRTIKVAMKLRWYNKNFVGVHFGGSLYVMTDPFLMLMTVENLGADYIVWDKAASIDFKKPGRGTVYATFHLSSEEIQAIRLAADTHEKYLFDRQIDIIDEAGEIIASVIKTIYVRKKTPVQAASNLP